MFIQTLETGSKIEIYNSAGNLVYETLVASGPVSEIDISMLQMGLYLVKTIAGNSLDTQKIVKL